MTLKHIYTIIISAIIVQSLGGLLYAAVIHVPEDFELISEAVDNAEDGDTIMVGPGVYRGGVGLLSEPQNLSIIGTPDMRTTWINLDFHEFDDWYAIQLDHENSINIENMVVEGFEYLILGGRNVTVSVVKCVIRTFTGVAVDTGSTVTIENCIFDEGEDTSYGISVGPASDMFIKRCVFIGHYSSVDFTNCTGVIENNLIINSTHGLTVFYPVGGGERQLPVILNNIFANCEFAVSLRDYGIEDVDQYNPRDYMIYNYNLQWNNEIDFALYLYEPDIEGVWYWWQEGEFEPQPGDGLIFEDPLLIDAGNGDYHLLDDSPCIDAGDPESPEDPDGTRADIGVYFYNQDLIHAVIYLDESWNMASSYVDPVEPDIPVIFTALVERESVLLVKDGFGRFYSPADNFNNIPYWNFHEGYLVKMSEEDSLVIAGEEVAPDTPIPLLEGWNMIAYFPEDEIEAPAAFANILDELIIAKDGAGNFYLPAEDFNNMPPLRRGAGYLIKVREEVELVWNVP